MNATVRNSPLALTVLGMLHTRPLHPYGIQRLIKQWGKDQVVNVSQRASLYRTIDRLHEAGLVSVQETGRDQQYPERTVYELTEAGSQAVVDWLSDMLALPRAEFPQFPAALSFMMLLPPAEAMVVLGQRADALRAQLAATDASLARMSGLPRAVGMDDEYQRTMTAAELTWVSGIIADLESGALTWSKEQLEPFAEASLPDGELRLRVPGGPSRQSRP